jgi:hypothetical protein
MALVAIASGFHFHASCCPPLLGIAAPVAFRTAAQGIFLTGALAYQLHNVGTDVGGAF